jgi:hypothetical protein
MSGEEILPAASLFEEGLCHQACEGDEILWSGELLLGPMIEQGQRDGSTIMVIKKLIEAGGPLIGQGLLQSDRQLEEVG